MEWKYFAFLPLASFLLKNSIAGLEYSHYSYEVCCDAQHMEECNFVHKNIQQLLVTYQAAIDSFWPSATVGLILSF